MPRKKAFYAVRSQFNEGAIYETLDQARRSTQDHSKANVKRFSSWIRAESWLGVKVKATFPLTKAQRRRAKTSLRQSVAVTTETSTTIPVSRIGATVPTNSHVPLLRRLPPNASGFPSYAMTAYIGSRYQVTTTGYSVTGNAPRVQVPAEVLSPGRELPSLEQLTFELLRPSLVTSLVRGPILAPVGVTVLQDAIMLPADHQFAATAPVRGSSLAPAAAATPVIQDTIMCSADGPSNITFPAQGTILPPAEPPTLQDTVVLSHNQDAVLQRVRQGRSVFFTGSAGTGKSVLIREIVRVLRDVDGLRPEEVAITALTGVAAINIGGCTIHSFAGFGIGIGTDEDLLDKITNSPYACKRWKETRTLIIDEVGMMHGITFDVLDRAGRIIRNRPDKPFGGIVVVLSGDFFQLPPVPRQDCGTTIPFQFAFEARGWYACVGEPMLLRQVFRQLDPTFSRMLNAIRVGLLTPQIVDALRQLERPLEDGPVAGTTLFPIKAQAEEHNENMLKKLSGPVQMYYAMDSRGFDSRKKAIPEDVAKRLLRQLTVPPALKLKKGAHVMLLRNMVQGRLVNGSLGVVEDFLAVGDALQLGVDLVSDASKVEQSRPHHAKDAKADALQQHTRRLLMAERRRSGEAYFGFIAIKQAGCFLRDQKWPLVVFENGLKLLCTPLEFEGYGFMGNVEVVRLQVPLQMAWALSIHKAQGQSLTKLKVDLDRSFECGMAYVALSRARTMQGLQVLNFEPSKIKVHPRVVEWTRSWMAEADAADELPRMVNGVQHTVQVIPPVAIPATQAPDDDETFFGDEEYLDIIAQVTPSMYTF